MLADQAAPLPAVVIDTNWVLDLFVFQDPGAMALRSQIEQRQVRWLATEAMHAELVRVLTYPQIVVVLLAKALHADQVLQAVHAHQMRVPAPSGQGHGIRCRDADDQMFIDLAVAHQADLLSKDKAVLALAKRLLRWNVRVKRGW